MKPLLDSEITLNLVYLKQTVINLPATLQLLQAANDLQDHPCFPFPNLSINLFRALIGAQPHPDDRGERKLFDEDEFRPGDDVVSPEMLQFAWAKLLEDNQGPFEKGELHKRYPELVAVLGIPNPTESPNEE